MGYANKASPHLRGERDHNTMIHRPQALYWQKIGCLSTKLAGGVEKLCAGNQMRILPFPLPPLSKLHKKGFCIFEVTGNEGLFQ